MKDIINYLLIIMVLCIVGGYHQRGYWAIGPELLIGMAVISIAISIVIGRRKHEIRYNKTNRRRFH